MSFLDTLPDVLATAATKAEAKWVGVGIDKLQTVVIPQLPGATQPVAKAVADVLAANTATADQVTHAGLTTIVSYMAVGAVDSARLVYLAQQADYDERQSSLLAAMRACLTADAERESAWAAVKQLALDLLKAGGQAAVPILLAMI